MSKKRMISDLLRRGIPYLLNEFRIFVSEHTPFFVAVPRSVYFSFGSRCNAFCVMCAIGRNAAAGKPAGGPELTEEESLRMLREIRELCGKGVLVSLTGGEPLLYAPIYRMIELSNELGINFSFTTNGYLLDEARIRKIAAIEPFGIGISVESLDAQINERIRPYKGGEGTAKTIRAIDDLIRIRKELKKNYRINIKTVITEVNMRTFPDLIRRYGREGGVMITPQPYATEGATEKHVEEFWVKDLEALRRVMEEVAALKKEGCNIQADENTLRDFVDYFAKGIPAGTKNPKRTSGVRRVCRIGDTTVFILPAGDIRLCPYMTPIGNLHDGRTLKQMWFGQEASRIRSQIRLCRIDCELSCTRGSSLWNRLIAFLKST
jgi:MoaA/NifB/PqqE/SkfB family radical SAM enzyme